MNNRKICINFNPLIIYTLTMEKAIETEITSYLLQKDYSLAQRQILEASVDTGNDPLI